MSRYVPPVAVPAEARELVDAILAKEEAFWDDVRAFNRDEGARTGMTIGRAIATTDEHIALTEQLRRKYFPRAHRIVVSNEGVITVSRTGRSIRRVWKLERVSEYVD